VLGEDDEFLAAEAGIGKDFAKFIELGFFPQGMDLLGKRDQFGDFVAFDLEVGESGGDEGAHGVVGHMLVFLHAAFGLVISVLAVEGAFYHYRKVPFACTYVPGKLKLQFTAIPVLIGLPLAMMALAGIEKTILRDPVRGVVVLAFAAAALFAMRFGNRTFYRTKPLLFEEQPEAAMVTFPEG
jgi:hypothetical protein